MEKLLLLAGLAVVGCAGEDPHDLGKCGETWSSATACEAACKQKPDTTGPRCRAACTPNGGSCQTSAPSYTCSATFTVDGQAGCCEFATSPTGLDVLFFECVE